jgi:hypothetical protein
VKGKITRIWLSTIKVSELDRALIFYHKTLGLPIALAAKPFNHMEVGPPEPLAKIGLEATGKQSMRKK